MKGSGVKILIADDHDLVRDTLVAFVEASGEIRTSTAPDLETACALVTSDGPFDLVLLDLNMPGMNGLDGLERALERGLPWKRSWQWSCRRQQRRACTRRCKSGCTARVAATAWR